jgi:hypothetical protein
MRRSKGRQLSVDAMTTSYAFVLRRLLEKGGLKPSEIEFVSGFGWAGRRELTRPSPNGRRVGIRRAWRSGWQACARN